MRRAPGLRVGDGAPGLPARRQLTAHAQRERPFGRQVQVKHARRVCGEARFVGFTTEAHVKGVRALLAGLRHRVSQQDHARRVCGEGRIIGGLVPDQATSVLCAQVCGQCVPVLVQR